MNWIFQYLPKNGRDQFYVYKFELGFHQHQRKIITNVLKIQETP